MTDLVVLRPKRASLVERLLARLAVASYPCAPEVEIVLVDPIDFDEGHPFVRVTRADLGPGQQVRDDWGHGGEMLDHDRQAPLVSQSASSFRRWWEGMHHRARPLDGRSERHHRQRQKAGRRGAAPLRAFEEMTSRCPGLNRGPTVYEGE